ncbi:MAG TPA: cellulase family glycosylhydrolase, partial [Chthoniobacterales bacterium]|nr:cellulase family glycosylhydrolase [Chthoniobacterales bacterium]
MGGINATLHFHNREKTELQTISAWGAKLVRVPLRADVEDENCDGFLSSDGKINEPAFLELDRLVDAASRLGLKIVLDLHTYPGGKSGRLWDDFGYWDDVTNL